MKPKQSHEHGEALPVVPHLLAQLVCPETDMTHLVSPWALGEEQHLPQGELQFEFVLRPCWRIWQQREHLQAPGAVCDGFAMRRTHGGALPCLLPIWYV